MSAALRLYHVPSGTTREQALERVSRGLTGLPGDRAWTVEVREHKPLRSNAQNALLWSLYTQILKLGGEGMRGWSKDDLHIFFLIEHFGHEDIEVFGRRRRVPVRRSSKLNKQEMSDHIAFIASFMRDQGVYLDLSQDELQW